MRILFTAWDQEQLVEITAAYCYYLQQELNDKGEICGPADAPYARIKDRWRRQLLIKATDATQAAAAAEQALLKLQKEERLPADLLFSLDIDPMSSF